LRKTFKSLYELTREYQTVKAGLGSMPTILPKKNGDFQKTYNKLMSRGIKEDKLIFVVDVEMFIVEYHKTQHGYLPIPLDCLEKIFQFICPYSETTYGQLARQFKLRIKHGENLPRRLKHRGNLHGIVVDIRNKAEQYFIQRGVIILGSDN